MLGDSLTQGYGLTEKNGLVPALQRWLSINNVEVLLINGGVSGNTTLGGAEQLDWLLSPDINGVVVALGGNDLLRGFDPEFTKNNLEKIFRNLKSNGITSTLVGTISPLNYGPQFKREFDEIYPTLAKKYNLYYIDSFFSPTFFVLRYPSGFFYIYSQLIWFRLNQSRNHPLFYNGVTFRAKTGS